MSATPERERQAAHIAAARVWSTRLWSELEAAARFRALVPALIAGQASRGVVAMAERAAADELRHAALCRQLVEHFGGPAPPEPTIVVVEPVAPLEVAPSQRVLFEVIALSCVTETLSTALLAELIRPAVDRECKRVMRSILRDEVRHSRLGWAYLAEQHARGAPDCVGPHLASMLQATLGSDFWRATPRHAEVTDLVGLGQLEHAQRQRIVLETLQHVVFPGLERFGVDTTRGRKWCGA